MKYKILYLVVSSAVIVPGLISLLLFGLRPSIDFTGGTVLGLKPTPGIKADQSQANLKQATFSASISNTQLTGYADAIKPLLEKNKTFYESVKAENSQITIRMKETDEVKKNELIKLISKDVVLVAESRFETLGPVLGRELLSKTIIGVVLASLLIAIYIIYQFKDRLFGICALLATVHDSLVILGTFSLLGHFFGIEVDTLFVTAVLTVLSFSVHDTIVVYDRIREKIRLSGVAFSGLSVPELESVVDSATNETLVRSLNNSLTVIFMLTALSILGGDSIRWFAAALLIGTISGSYSSPFVAGPLLIVFKRLQNRLAKR
jgi:preprotein translocase subunit SecF